MSFDASCRAHFSINMVSHDILGAPFMRIANKWGPTSSPIPVPLGWGLAYLVPFLVRWIKRGFRQPISSRSS
jgi:hypothetical protein